MPEILYQQAVDQEVAAAQATPEAEALANARTFIEREIPALQKITGLNVDVRIGKGWATNTETGTFAVDPSFFLERGYSAEHSVYATLHELMAHVRGVKRDPVGMARRNAFASQGEAQHLFNNILTDIEGNKFMHRMLPAQAKVAEDLYSTKLFPLEKDGKPVDYAAVPLHMQFLYKMIREEMIPDSETAVRPEVDAALARLRDYKGTGQDVIAYLTKPDPKLPDSDRFDMQLATIYPAYKALMEQAKEEAKNQTQQDSGEGQSGESQSGDQSAQNQETQPGSQNEDGTSQDKQQNGQPEENQNKGNEQPSQNGGEQQGSSEQGDPQSFTDAYKDYFENAHPEPMDEEQEKALEDMISQAVREQQQERTPDPLRKLDQTLREETGFGLSAHESYATEVEKHRDAIDAMRDVYRSVIQERVAQRRGLSRQSYVEGDILNPNRLPQLIIDKKAGVTEPAAFTRYEHVKGRTEIVGKTDYIFVFDRSSSMSENGKSTAAATSALILLEALAGMERDVVEAEKQTGIELDLDIRTALYTFTSEQECLKPLSPGLSDAERLNARQSILQPSGSTADFLALDEVAAIPVESDRKRIVIAVSDGESDDSDRAAHAIQRLKQQGVEVFGVGIGSDAATRLYAPSSRRVDNPSDLPDVLQSFIESTLR